MCSPASDPIISQITGAISLSSGNNDDHVTGGENQGHVIARENQGHVTGGENQGHVIAGENPGHVTTELGAHDDYHGTVSVSRLVCQ